MWGAGFKWMFLIIGTTIGAGYASGRELWQFFGHESGLAILLFTIFFTVSCYVIMDVSYRRQSSDYLPVLRDIVGPKLTKVYDIMIFLYLFTTTVVMIAGSGATGQAFQFSYWWGVVLITIGLIALFLKDINGLLAMNQIVLPLLLGGLVYILLLFIIDQELDVFSHWHEQRNWTAAFPFTALNILPLIAVLGAIGNKVKSKREIHIAAIGSGFLLGTISFIYNSSLIQIADELLLYEIPLFAILKHYPFEILILMSALLWFAIFTTAAAGILGIATRLQSIWNIPIWMLAAVLIAVMIPLTTLGFSTLISYIYPIYGILNLYVLSRLLLYPLWGGKQNKEA
ncbi:YkvI family membrane protein [Lentibacillus juripiscarius]|uniref:Membrane protein YkvI n=1 Tax=Lentibacillus juripiscarius TaxID=257446 RepID=A0ABW5V9N2_9BACI